MKTLIKQAVQDEIDEMDHQPNKVFDGEQYHYEWKELDWESVALRLYELMPETDLSEQTIYETIELAIEWAERQLWVEDMLEDARYLTDRTK